MTRLRLLLLPAVMIAASSCLDARQRLDAPRVSIALDVDTVDVGTDVTGVAYAGDATGIIYVAAELFIDGETEPRRRMRDDYLDADSVVFPFALYVDSVATSGTRLLVRAVAIDNQLFTVTTEDTAYVR